MIVVCAFNTKSEENYDYLRLHIRANSNINVDQNIKYKIKDLVVEILTPELCQVESKQQAINVVEKFKPFLISKCNQLLYENGFSYTTNIKVNNEYFPTRSYNNTTLESGYYDAVVIELGDGVGDNWWCVMYPPLCFVNKFENNKQIKYKSRLVEWFNNLFN